MLYKIIYSRIYKFLEKNSRGKYKDSSYNAMLFTTLLVTFNVMTLFFLSEEVFSYEIYGGELVMYTLLYLLVVYISGFLLVIYRDRYINIVEEVNTSKYSGRLGSLVFVGYLVVTFLSLGILFTYYSIRNGFVKFH